VQPSDLELLDVEALELILFTVKARIAKAPIARAPMPVAPIAARANATCIPEEDRSTCATLRILITCSPVPALR
jgi:hypothetical protein